MKNIMFPVPRITESFIEDVIDSLGWKKYAEIMRPVEGRLNVDFIAEDAIIELKILEEEGLEKKERQDKIAKLYMSMKGDRVEIDLEIERAPENIRNKLEEIVSKPIQSVIKKASKQIKHTREDMNLPVSKGILLIVNNGYSSLNADIFERLVQNRASRDSTQIDFVFCVTVEHHQGDFDAFTFCITNCYSINGRGIWECEKMVKDGITKKFADAMTIKMRDQMNPDFWKSNLEPVSDILFEREGVRYIRRAPEVPDSRF